MARPSLAKTAKGLMLGLTKKTLAVTVGSTVYASASIFSSLDENFYPVCHELLAKNPGRASFFRDL